MILEGETSQEMAMADLAQKVRQTRWRLTHHRALAPFNMLGKGLQRRFCDGRLVNRHHFFKHSRGFLWFLICNLLISGGSGGAQAQLLINVQNQVRPGESSDQAAAKQPKEEETEAKEEVFPMEQSPAMPGTDEGLDKPPSIDADDL